jgi:hypothetical protein
MSRLAFLACLLCFLSPMMADDSDERIRQAAIYCDGSDCSQVAWVFADLHISFVCRYDFRRDPAELESPRWPPNMKLEDEAIWGDFMEYLINLIPEVAEAYSGEIVAGSGLFRTHGGEGMPNWDIPACGTNRTQGFANLAYFSALLNVTADEDFSVRQSQIDRYLNEASVRVGIEQYLCDDLERVFIGFGVPADEAGLEYYYPRPEEICPRVEDDGFWSDWQAYVLLVLVLGLAAALVGVLLGCWCMRRRAETTSTDIDDKPSTPMESHPDVEV